MYGNEEKTLPTVCISNCLLELSNKMNEPPYLGQMANSQGQPILSFTDVVYKRL